MKDKKTPEELDQEKFRVAIKNMFSGEHGKFALEYMARAHVYPSALGSTPEMTAYQLGIKEFVQRLIDYAKYDKDSNTYQE